MNEQDMIEFKKNRQITIDKMKAENKNAASVEMAIEKCKGLMGDKDKIDLSMSDKDIEPLLDVINRAKNRLLMAMCGVAIDFHPMSRTITIYKLGMPV